MGFDPDRASLLTSLMATGMTAAIMALAEAPIVHGVIAGLVAGVLTFGQTAVQETAAALRASDTYGTFDLTGWLDSILVFVIAFAVAGWMAAVLARESGTTPKAWRPFGGNATVMSAVSPINVILHIPAALRANMFYAIVADPRNAVYGVQMQKFASVLHDAGVPMALFPTPLGHTWEAAREFVPTMLQLLAGRMVTLGVLRPSG
jgi:hypothetical protein